MIVHYIEQHQYCPPDEFVVAVRTSPLQGSEAFMALMADFISWLESSVKTNQRANNAQEGTGAEATPSPQR